MNTSLGIAICFHNERDAISGFLENAHGFFDDILMADCGPDGKPSDDGTLDIIRAWGIEPKRWSINDGFGVIRSRLIHESTTEFVWISDADERFFPVMEVLRCEGTEKFPEVQNPTLTVTPTGETYNHGKALRSLINTASQEQMAIVGVRRHWHSFDMRHPSQNWEVHKDLQCRCIRNSPHVGFKPEEKMHEKIVDFRTGGEPNMIRIEHPYRGIFWDHFSVPFKRMNPAKNASDLATYRALHEPSTRTMWLNHQPGVK